MAKKRDYHDLIVTPFKTKIRNFTSIADFYMYYAPEIDSPQSYGKFEMEEAEKVLNIMLKTTKMSEKACFQEKIRSESWGKRGIESDVLDFEDSRFLCSKSKDETQLHALLRHIRNALAHGNLYIWKKQKKGNYVFLIDKEPQRGTQQKKITAKIMVSLEILEQWKAILENQIAIGE